MKLSALLKMLLCGLVVCVAALSTEKPKRSLASKDLSVPTISAPYLGTFSPMPQPAPEDSVLMSKDWAPIWERDSSLIPGLRYELVSFPPGDFPAFTRPRSSLRPKKGEAP